MATTWWLQCEVLPGLFTTERLCVVREATHGRALRIVVDSNLVQADGQPSRGKPVPGRVRVHRSGGGPGEAVVLLPAQSAECGSFISVPEAELAPAT